MGLLGVLDKANKAFNLSGVSVLASVALTRSSNQCQGRTFAHSHIRTSAHPHIRTSAHPHAAAFIAERPPLCTPTDLFASTPVVFFADSRIMRHPSNSSRPPLDQSKPTDRIPLLLPVHHGGAERATKASGVSCEPSPGLVKRAQGMKGGWWGVVVIGV